MYIFNKEMKLIGYDTETEDPYLTDKGTVKARGISAVFGKGKIIVTGLYTDGKKTALDGDGGEQVRSLLTNPDIAFVGANIVYDIVWVLSSLNMTVKECQCKFIDVQIVESLIDEYQKFNLDSLALKYLNEHKGKDALEQIALNHRMHGDFRQHLSELWDLGYEQEIRDYVLSDADQPVRIFEQQYKILQEQGLIKAFEMNMAMIPVVVQMKLKGANFDFKKWLKNCEKAGNAFSELKDDYESKYGEVNINSPKQLAEQFDRLNVPYKMKIGIKGWQVQGRKFKNATDLFQGDELSKQKKTLKEIFPGVAIEKGRLVLYVAKRYGERTAAQLRKMGYEVSLNPCINKSLFTELKNTYEVVADLVQYKQAKNLTDKFLGPAFGRFIVLHSADGTQHPALYARGNPEYDKYTDDRTKDYILNPMNDEPGATWRIHGDFNIVGARQTGRLSGSKPNCIAEGMRVYTVEYGYIPIETVKPGMHVITHTGQVTTVLNVWDKGMQECIKLTTTSNLSIICTKDHKFFNGTEWIKAQDIEEVQLVSIKDSFSRQGNLLEMGKVRHSIVGAVRTFDIEVEHSDHSFIVEGFLAHNCQQVPSKTSLFPGTDREVDLAKMCRECFIAEKGGFFLKQDYAAQENRLAAHFAPGKNGDRIRKMYNDDPYLDEHEYAATVSGLTEEHGPKVGRKYAKNLRFGLSYGMGIPRMIINFGWTKEFAEDLYEKISSAAPWLFDLMETIQTVVLKRRYIKTLAGRRIHLRRGHDKDAYAFMNYLIQGSASDMTKLATVAVYNSQSCELMNLTVHDEDDFSLPANEEGIRRALEIGHLMENSFDVSVPMLSEPEIGTSWADGVEYDRAFGTREEFITSAVNAIRDGKWTEFRKAAKDFLKKDEDDDISFNEFCTQVMEEEEEEESVSD